MNAAAHVYLQGKLDVPMARSTPTERMGHTMTYKMLIPRNRIPKFKAICVVCSNPKVRTKVAAPYADGYYRRHECSICNAVFHTLSPYDGSTPRISDKMFKDRELTELEAAQRMAWWKQEED